VAEKLDKQNRPPDQRGGQGKRRTDFSRLSKLGIRKYIGLTYGTTEKGLAAGKLSYGEDGRIGSDQVAKFVLSEIANPTVKLVNPVRYLESLQKAKENMIRRGILPKPDEAPLQDAAEPQGEKKTKAKRKRAVKSDLFDDEQLKNIERFDVPEEILNKAGMIGNLSRHFQVYYTSQEKELELMKRVGRLADLREFKTLLSDTLGIACTRIRKMPDSIIGDKETLAKATAFCLEIIEETIADIPSKVDEAEQEISMRHNATKHRKKIN